MTRPFRMLHTADWHIGKTLFGQPLLDDQRHVLDQLIGHVRTVKPDVVVIAGDIYDRSVPPADAVELLDATLTALVGGLATPVVLIAGNHDGPERLGFGAHLLQRAGLTVRGPVDLQAAPIRFDSAGFPVALCPLPYAEPATVRTLLGDGERGAVPDHQAALQAQIRSAQAQLRPGEVAVAVAHAFVQGGRVVDHSEQEYSETERQLAVGGTAVVDPSVFAGFAYVALGHLHQPQKVAAARPGLPSVRYSGSLLQYSFAEADQARSATLVELAPDGTTQTTELPLRPRRPLRTVRGTLAQLVAQGQNDPNRHDFIAATLTDPGMLLDPLGRLREGYPNVLHIERPQLQGGDGALLQGDHRQRQPIDIVHDFWQSVCGEALPEPARGVLVPLLAQLSRRDGGAA
ncbi:MAG: exonuclease SbcCD subunit D [Deltaproteobacteria bacterium]|nr:exonuclease SbcCD subunit D [Deltaproteobacteria bacterium]